MDKCLRIEGLSKQYGMAPPVIQSLSYRFKAGTITGLKGNNGSGKSTLMKLVSFSSLPDSGSIFFNEKNILDDVSSYLIHLGVVADWLELPSMLTFTELLTWRMEQIGLEKQAQHQQLNHLKQTFGFDERSENQIGTYSSGMKKKTAICAALCTNPDILLFDEPFLTLDVPTQHILEQVLLEQKRLGKIIILSSHNDDHEEKLFDNLLQFPLH